MLAPDDRAVLREELRPPPGATFDYGIATTFTLDLTAALVAPLAFAAHHVRQSADPVAVLEAVRSVTDRLDVFCQAGQIRVPPTASDLMAFLEPMVHEVVAPRPGFLFHPKVWVLRFVEANGEPAYRLLCGTRNLTDDVSWDAVVRLDGYPAGRRPISGNRPLAELISALPGLAVRSLAPKRRARLEGLAEDIRRVEWVPPDDMRDVVFHTLGLAGQRNRPAVVLDTLYGRRHLVVSPFLDDKGVAAATAGGSSPTIVSRPEALDRLQPATLEGVDCRIVSPLAGLHHPDDEDDGGDGTSTETTRSLLGGLHAKVYVVEAARQVRVVIGSANATEAGLEGGNVEFLVEMLGRPKHIAVEKLVGADADFASILERYEPIGGETEPPEETLARELERHIRSLAARPLEAQVEPTGSTWRERVTGDAPLDLPSGSSLKVRLLTLDGTAVSLEGPALEALFESVALPDITPFVVLELSAHAGPTLVERSAVVRADLVGDPPGRFDEVIARQVDTPEKFMRFLALLLGLGGIERDSAAGPGGDGTAWSFGRLGSVGIFELLVRSVADQPEAIDDLARLVERLEASEQGRAILPDGFSELWAAVLKARRALGRPA